MTKDKEKILKFFLRHKKWNLQKNDKSDITFPTDNVEC